MSDKKKLMIWSVIGTFVVFLLAGGWHFLYSDILKSGVTAAIAPVNESPWEHAKMFFVPALIWYIILYLIAGRKFPNFVFSHAVSLLVMPVLIFGLFYTYQLFVLDNLIVDIIISFVVIALGQLIAYKLTVSKRSLSGPVYTVVSLAIVLGLFVLYTVFTYNPPHFEIFADPESGRYGI